MSATAPGSAFGAKFQVNDGSSGAYADLNNVISIEYSGEDVGNVKTTHLGSSNQHHTQGKGWQACGTFTVKQNWTSAEYDRIVLLVAQASTGCKCTLPDATDKTYSFTGHPSRPKLMNIGIDDDAMQMDTVWTQHGAIS